MNHLQVIATLIHSCPPPDVMCGFDMCPCGIGCTWPCPTTQAAWIARGLNPDAEISRLMAEAIASVTT